MDVTSNEPNIVDDRSIAMSWWNGLASARKTQICDTNTWLVGSVRRWETLTGREIEQLYSREYSLYGNPCRNNKCVYNVSRVCKCNDVGSTCKSHTD